ncbi:hypothetical protein E2542_SST15467 [Spatholobus suberectus]|nr:hypothetical protein E2542_SST15467 [Spatholobus suberectus]
MNMVKLHNICLRDNIFAYSNMHIKTRFDLKKRIRIRYKKGSSPIIKKLDGPRRASTSALLLALIATHRGPHESTPPGPDERRPCPLRRPLLSTARFFLPLLGCSLQPLAPSSVVLLHYNSLESILFWCCHLLFVKANTLSNKTPLCKVCKVYQLGKNPDKWGNNELKR